MYILYSVTARLKKVRYGQAAMFAAHNKLDNLVIFVDQNGLQIDGTVDEVAGIEPLDKKFESFGFEVFKIDGHDSIS